MSFKNSKGIYVPHCEDCPVHKRDEECPDDAINIVDEEDGVLKCPGYAREFGVTL